MGTAAGPTWTSEREHRLSDVERERESRFKRDDERIGRDAVRKYGRARQRTARLRPVAIARSIAHRAVASPSGTFLRRLVRRLEREVIRRAHRVARAISPPATSRHGRFDVVTEPRTANDANAVLARARTPFLVFVREGGELTTAGAAALDEAIAVDGSADLIFGDSRSWSGVRFGAPAFSPFRLRSEAPLSRSQSTRSGRGADSPRPPTAR